MDSADLLAAYGELEGLTLTEYIEKEAGFNRALTKGVQIIKADYPSPAGGPNYTLRVGHNEFPYADDQNYGPIVTAPSFDMSALAEMPWDSVEILPHLPDKGYVKVNSQFSRWAENHNTNPEFRLARWTIGQLIGRYLPDEGNVLDAGCNDGYMLMQMHRAKPGLRLHGIDLNADSVDVAERRLQGFAEIRQGNAFHSDLRFRGRRFDVINAVGLMNHVVMTERDSRDMLHYLGRQLTDGGKLIIAGYSPCHNQKHDFEDAGFTVQACCAPPLLYRNSTGILFPHQFYVMTK